METRIIRTRLYRDREFRKLSHRDKFVVLFLLTNEFLEAIPAVEIGLDFLAFHASVTEKYLKDLLPTLEYFQIFYRDGFLIVGDLFTYSNYKGGKTDEKRERLFKELPQSVKKLVNIEGEIAQSLLNDCSTIAHINHKPETINHKTKAINLKKDVFGFEDYVKGINKILGRNFSFVKGTNTKARRQFKARLKEGYTEEHFEVAVCNAKVDKFHIENNYKYLTPEFFSRQDKLEQWVNAGPHKLDKLKANAKNT